MSEAEVRLALTDLAVGYRGNALLSGISATLHAGELTCLLGPNGIGKSTLLRTLARAQPALVGQIRLNGRPITELSQRELARELAIVLTDRIAVGQLRGYDLVALGRSPHTGWFGRLDDEDRRVIADALETANAGHLADRAVPELSDGERQRLMIARALAQEPSILLLDEPTAFLDVSARLELIGLLRSLTREHGLAVLMSTHDVEQMLRHADSLWVVTPDGLVTGVPEDVGLAGYLPGLDPLTGTFVRDRRRSGTATIRAPATCPADLVAWTTRAAERAGFLVADHRVADVAIDIRAANGDARWLVGPREFDSLGALVGHLADVCTRRP